MSLEKDYKMYLKISELIEELEEAKKQYGDIPVGHISHGLDVYWSPRKIKEWGSERAFDKVVRVSNIRYWEKESPMVAIIDYPTWGWRPLGSKSED